MYHKKIYCGNSGSTIFFMLKLEHTFWQCSVTLTSLRVRWEQSRTGFINAKYFHSHLFCTQVTALVISSEGMLSASKWCMICIDWAICAEFSEWNPMHSLIMTWRSPVGSMQKTVVWCCMAIMMMKQAVSWIHVIRKLWRRVIYIVNDSYLLVSSLCCCACQLPVKPRIHV